MVRIFNRRVFVDIRTQSERYAEDRQTVNALGAIAARNTGDGSGDRSPSAGGLLSQNAPLRSWFRALTRKYKSHTGGVF